MQRDGPQILESCLQSECVGSLEESLRGAGDPGGLQRAKGTIIMAVTIPLIFIIIQEKWWGGPGSRGDVRRKWATQGRVHALRSSGHTRWGAAGPCAALLIWEGSSSQPRLCLSTLELKEVKISTYSFIP